MEISGIFTSNINLGVDCKKTTFEDLMDISDALYIISEPSLHYYQIRMAIESGKHILCETPIALTSEQSTELHALAEDKCVRCNQCVKVCPIKAAKGLQ